MTTANATSSNWLLVPEMAMYLITYRILNHGHSSVQSALIFIHLVSFLTLDTIISPLIWEAPLPSPTEWRQPQRAP